MDVTTQFIVLGLLVITLGVSLHILNKGAY